MVKNTIYSRFKRLIGASEIFLLNQISLISKDTYLLIKIQENVLFEDYQLSLVCLESVSRIVARA